MRAMDRVMDEDEGCRVRGRKVVWKSDDRAG